MTQGRRLWLAGVPVFAACTVFFPVLRYPFVYDEFVHFYDLVNFGPFTLLVTPHGGHLKFFSNLVYLPLHGVFGVWAPPYYLLALITHLANVALCYRLALRFSGRPIVAVSAAALWGCAAVNLGAIGWFDVYGQLLVATILLVLLHDVARLADDRRQPSSRTIAWWAVLLFAASGSFGNGLCIAALFLPVATFMEDANATWRRICLQLVCSTFAVGALYLIGQWLPTLRGRAVLDPVTASYGVSSVSFSNALVFVRALVASVGAGIGSLFAPAVLEFENGAIVAGPLRELVRGPAELVVSIALIAWLIGGVFALRRRPPGEIRRAIGLGVLALACYALVSARTVGVKETSVIPPGAHIAGIKDWAMSPVGRVTAPRYQYLPTLLLMLATVAALPRFAGAAPARRATGLAVLLWVAISVLSDAAMVHAHPLAWDAQALVEKSLRRDVGYFPPRSTVYIDNGPSPIPLVPVDPVLPGHAAIALLLFPQLAVDGHRLYFVERDRDLLSQLRSGGDRPIAHLVVGADEVPDGAAYVRRRQR